MILSFRRLENGWAELNFEMFLKGCLDGKSLSCAAISCRDKRRNNYCQMLGHSEEEFSKVCLGSCTAEAQLEDVLLLRKTWRRVLRSVSHGTVLHPMCQAVHDARDALV